MEVFDRIRRGRPMCRPANRSREEACPGGHTGPPLRGGGNVPEITEIGTENEHSPSGAGRGGTEPAPYRRQEQNGCGGVWSPRPTGASQVVPSDGPPYLGHGLRRPNSVPKFGASVKSSAPTEGLPKPWAAAPTGASQAVPRNTGRGRDSSRRARKPRPGAQGGNQKKGGTGVPPFCQIFALCPWSTSCMWAMRSRILLV